MNRRLNRARERGAAMVEAIVVISIFILFFLGMVYFESLYHEQLRVQQLARAGAFAYAMKACPDGEDATLAVQADLHNASGGSSPQTGNANVPVQSKKQVGNQGSDPLGGAMKMGGFALDKITDVKITGKAAGTTQSGGLFSPRWGFRRDVVSDSYLSCGDPQKDGNAGGLFSLVKSAFPMSPPSK